MKQLLLLAVCGLLISSCGQDEITFRNPIKVEPEQSVRGDWTEDDLAEANTYGNKVVNEFGIRQSEGAADVCGCVTNAVEDEFTGPNDPRLTEGALQKIAFDCIHENFVDAEDAGGR
jgi:hypothetical protein